LVDSVTGVTYGIDGDSLFAGLLNAAGVEGDEEAEATLGSALSLFGDDA